MSEPIRGGVGLRPRTIIIATKGPRAVNKERPRLIRSENLEQPYENGGDATPAPDPLREFEAASTCFTQGTTAPR